MLLAIGWAGWVETLREVRYPDRYYLQASQEICG